MSNWATATIIIERNDKPSGLLQFIFLIFGAMLTATACGWGRFICLQAILNPEHKWPLCGKICGGFCAPPPEPGETGLSAADVRHDYMMTDDVDEMSNPVFEVERSSVRDSREKDLLDMREKELVPMET